MDSTTIFALKVVAGLHIVFAVAEIFLWEYLTPRLKIFDVDKAKQTASVGKNMGCYNGILAACLIWLVVTPGLDLGTARSLATLYLVSIVIAGAFGGLTIKWTIPIFQSVPALYALKTLWW